MRPVPADNPADNEVTRVLDRASGGDPEAAEQLLPLVYEELRSLAAHRMAHEPAGHTLQPTALVHEAYVRLLGDEVRWDGRGHFFGAAARAMRRILIDRARRHGAAKHGGNRVRVDLSHVEGGAVDPSSEDLLALDEVLRRLEQIDDRKGRIVMLRYFAGLTIEQTAEALGVSATTVKDEWSFARAWLAREIRRP